MEMISSLPGAADQQRIASSTIIKMARRLTSAGDGTEVEQLMASTLSGTHNGPTAERNTMSESSSFDGTLSRTAFELKRIWEAVPRICGICRFVTSSIEQRVDSLFYENVNDPPTREEIRKAGGFCRYHAHFINQQADALGTAIILRDVLTNHLRTIDSGEYDRPTSAPSGLGRLFDGRQADSWEREIKCRSCPICDFERDVTDLAIDSLLEGLADRRFAEIFGKSDGLCLAHFRLAFARARDHPQWTKVLDTEKRALQRLTHRLAELARKHDYRFKDEPIGEEVTSWREALNTSSSWVEK
jgi:hypothetical protein